MRQSAQSVALPNEVARRSQEPNERLGEHPRLLVVSPHFDDAIFSCGALLAAHQNAAVLTVFSAIPTGVALTEWDRLSGFKTSEDAQRARMAEDDAALAAVDVTPIRLPFFDHQYGHPASISEIREALLNTIVSHAADVIAIPLGLFHFDHDLVGNVGCSLMARFPELKWFAYEDAVYRQIRNATKERLAHLKSYRIITERAEILSQSHIESIHSKRLKQDAVDSYASQLRAFEAEFVNYQDVLEHECFWRLSMK